jgi:hypothetical protein
MSTKRTKKQKVLLGDVASLQDYGPELLARVFAMPFTFLVPAKLLPQLKPEVQELLSDAEARQQLRLLKISTKEQMKAGALCPKGPSFDDTCAAVLAKREKAMLILNDSYWHQKDVAFNDVEMPPPNMLQLPYPIMLMVKSHSVREIRQRRKHLNNKAG